MAVSLKRRFDHHKSSAGQRGVPFLLTFDQWLQIWQESGHLHERGCRSGQYVMSRHGDIGSYEVGNVSIVPCEANNREANLGKPKPISLEHSRKLSLAKMGNTNRLGCKDSEETRRRKSLVAQGRVAWNKGISCPEEVKRQISRSLLGQKRSEQTKQRISAGVKAFHQNRKEASSGS